MDLTKPIIGIIPSKNLNKNHYFVHKSNIEAIEKSGGIPIMLPYIQDQEQIGKIVHLIDGLYLTGGEDIDPSFYGEEPHQKLGEVIPVRDNFELKFIKKVMEQNKPILGVCRGSQLLNVALGGSLFQDIYSQVDGEVIQHLQKAPIEHQSHTVNVLKGSLLHRLVEKEEIKVNSRHHQAVREKPDSLQVSGRASDGIVEAIEGKGDTFILGLQWHPENMAVVNDESSRKIYDGFIKACKEWRNGEKNASH